jgi:hypothetical protein
MHRIALAVFYLSLSAAATVTPEETMVRNAYAKLSYAVDVKTAEEAISANPNISPADLATLVAKRSLRFSLSDFTCDNFANILDEKYADIFDKYSGDVIYTSLGTSNYNEAGLKGTMNMATAKWGAPPEGRLPDWTVRQMIPHLEQESGVTNIAPLRKYCTYTATAALAGRTVAYQAAFFFGANGQARQDDSVVGVGGGGLDYFLRHPVYPTFFLQPRLAANPAVQAFLTSTQRSDSSCKANSGDVCCDTVHLRCGVYTVDLNAVSPNLPLHVR